MPGDSRGKSAMDALSELANETKNCVGIRFLHVSQVMGFDFERGRLDVSVHPFTGGPHPTDVRITTRFCILFLLLLFQNVIGAFCKV